MSEQSTTMTTRKPNDAAKRQEGPASHINIGETERLLSAIGGGALLLHGLRRSLGSLVLAVGGGMLLYRGLSGHCRAYESLGLNTASDAGEGVGVEATVTVYKPIADVYRFYRNLENHPRFVTHLKSVQNLDQKRSHWVAKSPLQTAIEWDSEIEEERENHLLSWRSLPGADVDNMGTVRFRELPGERGTEVHVSLEFQPPGGMVGSAIAKLLNTITTQRLREDLRHFKQLLESGEQPTLREQPAGR